MQGRPGLKKDLGFQSGYGSRGDPIAAIATPLGESALAIIRTSGGGEVSGGDAVSAVELLAKVFSRPQLLLNITGNSVVHGWILDVSAGNTKPEASTKQTAGLHVSAGNTKPEASMRQTAGLQGSPKIDEVLVSVYRSPHSYTGEDGADISCHGGIATVKAVMSTLKKAGFREALPGEFTFRAFMNGKLDLTRAESVMELVSAKTNKGREQAVRRLSGILEKEISGIKEMLVQVLASTEIYLDYSEDEFFDSENAETSGIAGDEIAGRLPNRNLLEETVRRLQSLADLWSRERIYAEGALAVIAGRPNAGKSSLFNYLIREDRSIVTDVPGTTRDWIEARISFEGIPLRLADTAGLRNESGEVERIGIQRSFELLDKADLVLYLLDGAEGITGEDREFIAKQKETGSGKPVLILWNKADLAPPQTEHKTKFHAVSAKTGEGISALMHLIASSLETSSAGFTETNGENTAGPGSERQKELIDDCIVSLEEARILADRREPLDLIAPFLRAAINSLGEITGEVSTADILDTIFSRFCVGK